MNVLKVSRIVKVANKTSVLEFISLLSEIEGRLKLLQAYSILYEIDGCGDDYFSFKRFFRTVFLVAGRLTEYKLLGLVPDSRVNYLDDIFEQCKEVLDNQNWNLAVEFGAGLAQEVLDEHAETLLTAYVEGADTSLLKDFVKWYLRTY